MNNIDFTFFGYCSRYVTDYDRGTILSAKNSDGRDYRVEVLPPIPTAGLPITWRSHVPGPARIKCALWYGWPLSVCLRYLLPEGGGNTLRPNL